MKCFVYNMVYKILNLQNSGEITRATSQFYKRVWKMTLNVFRVFFLFLSLKSDSNMSFSYSGYFNSSICFVFTLHC